MENLHLTAVVGRDSPAGAAFMPGHSSNGEFIDGFDEFGQDARIYPVGPEPTVFEMARWGVGI